MSKIKKLTKAEIIEFYHTLSYPEKHGLDFVPHEMRLKSFEKLLAWQNIHVPEAASDNKPQKMLFEIVVAKD